MAKVADQEIGRSTTDKGVTSTTKIGGVILGIVILIGILMMIAFFYWGTSAGRQSRISSENTTSRPAEP